MSDELAERRRRTSPTEAEMEAIHREMSPGDYDITKRLNISVEPEHVIEVGCHCGETYLWISTFDAATNPGCPYCERDGCDFCASLEARTPSD